MNDMFPDAGAPEVNVDYSNIYEDHPQDSNDVSVKSEPGQVINETRQHDTESLGLMPIPKKSRTIKTDKPRPFLCPICTRGFVRQEHLKRHQRSHTNEKPFLCVFCGRCFARRDLVLRHQHKLHASLVGKNPSENISSSSSSNDISDTDENRSLLSSSHNVDPDKNIIKIIGNKESILPTPSNPMARTTAQLKKAAREAAAIINTTNSTGNSAVREAYSASSVGPVAIGASATPGESINTPSVVQPIETNPLRKRRRHASFSASSAFTYINDNLKSDQIAKELEFTQDIPHQVGFATPQLTAQELMDKLVEAGGIDVEALGLPQDFSLDDMHPHSPGAANTMAANISKKNGGNETGNYHSNGVPNNWSNGNLSELRDQYNIARNSSIPSFSVPMTPQAYLLKSTPSISNFLTMGTTCGGGGYSGLHSSDSNLTSFKYESFDSLDSYLEMLPVKPDKVGTSKVIGINSRDPNLNGSVNKPPVNSTTEKKARDSTSNIEDDQWLSEFIYGSDLSPSFKVNFDSINDIGFADLVSNPSVSESPLMKEQASLNSIRSIIPSTKGIPHQKRKKLSRDLVSISPTTSSSISASNSPYPPNRKGSFSLGPGITSFFTSRQKDLLDMGAGLNLMGSTPSPLTASSEDTSPDLHDASAKFKMSKRVKFFTNEFRSAIIKDSNMKPELFPTLQELNNYVYFYQYEFHRYFPFIHLHTIVPKMDNYPIILSIAMIGALYGFHSTHAMLLSNICWHKIRDYLNSLKNSYEKTPLCLMQSMVLLIFFGIFSNDLNVTKTMNSRLVTLIKLVKLTKLNLPLESIQMPPIESDHVLQYQDNPELLSKMRAQYNTPEQIVKDFQYFITAQARIRTCHMLLLISNLFTSFVGLESCFHSIDLKCGVPCFYEKLYMCENAIEWGKNLSRYHIVLDSKFSLIQLANGFEDYQHCLMYISTGSQYYFETSKVSFKTLLSMLISIHEKIFMERNSLKHEDNIQNYEMKWRMNSRPAIESMLKYWEALYIKNGGILIRNEENIPLINENPAMSLIIVLHLFANIRKCVYLTDVMNKAWLKQWTEMNQALDNFCSDWDSLREATDYALNVIDFWADTVSIMQNAERTAIGTPIFSITCIFSSILIVSEHMRHVEAWGQEFDAANSSAHVINSYDRMLWLKSEQTLKKVEDHLLPKGYNKQSYAEFLRSQANGALDVDVLDNELAQNAMKPDNPIASTIDTIIKARLSSRSLYLGVRILGDAPIWPVAVLLAHALQARAIYNVKSLPDVIPMRHS